ncbi:MAG: cation:proton antiporter [Candidatus Omnitrophota bacterium]
MFDFISHIPEKISVLHLNMLLLLGLALFGGTIGGRLFQKLRIPQVVGYIIIGIIIGQSGLKIVNQSTIEALKPFNYFALGLIGFMVGGELKKEIFAKYGRNFIYILLCEGIAPFILVTVSIAAVGTYLFGGGPHIWALALLLGAIASATDPASTTSVLKEFKTRGPLTTTILGIVALDDGLALFLFAIASSIAGVLVGCAGTGAVNAILYPLYEIGGAVVIGGLSGLVLNRILRKYTEKERILAFCIGIVLMVTGLSLAADVSMLMAAMTLGIVVVNFTPHKSKEVFNLVEGFTPPIYILFFVLVGAKLEFSHMTPPILLLVLVYLLFGLAGKMIGARIGAYLSKAPATVSRYLPLALFSQAGVAIGLSILAAQHFTGSVGGMLVVIITATTFATQILGPPFTKLAVSKAGEVGLNISEEEIIQKSRAEDIMDKDPPVIFEDMQLSDILKIFSNSDYLYYPVIKHDKALRGIITVEGIKQTFLEMDIGGLILAHDLMEPVPATTNAGAPVTEIKELLNRYDIDYLPVLDNAGKIEGFIERKKLNKFISTKIIEFQKQIDSLG